jgi:hypothetical protein
MVTLAAVPQVGQGLTDPGEVGPSLRVGVKVVLNVAANLALAAHEDL